MVFGNRKEIAGKHQLITDKGMLYIADCCWQIAN